MDYVVKEVESTDDSAIMEAIGRLRYDVWFSEDSIDATLFPDRIWLEPMDDGKNARHWIAMAGEEVVAAARLTKHESVKEDDYRDIKLWRDQGLALNPPVVDFGRLVVRKDHRRKGLARELVRQRLEAAQSWGAKHAVNTCSQENVRFLVDEFGFFEIGATAVFHDRPNTTFHALQKNFE